MALTPACWKKTGNGTLVLTGTNTYSGGTTISAGTVQLGDGGTTGSIMGDVGDNGVLVFQRAGSVTFDGVISGSGELIQAGTGIHGGQPGSAGTLILDGNSGATLATLGLRGAWNLGHADHPVDLHAGLGWREAFGSHAPTARLHFAGSDSFSVTGLPLPGYALVTHAGLSFTVSDKVSVDFSYSGLVGSHASDQGARFTLNASF